MRAIQEFLYRIRIDSIFELLAYIGFFYFLYFLSHLLRPTLSDLKVLKTKNYMTFWS